MSQCVTKTKQDHPQNKQTKKQTRDIYSTFQTQGPAKIGQMSSAYQISKLYKVQSLRI